MAQWIWSALLGSAVFVTALPAQAILKPGSEPCDKAERRASSVVLRAKHSLLAQAEPSEREIALFETTLVNATDAYLHCEFPSTPPEELETSIVKLFQARRVINLSRPPEGGEPPMLGLSVDVSIPLERPTLRVVDFEVKNQRIESHIHLIYAPNPQNAMLVSAKNGRLIPTDLPDGLVRISGPGVLPLANPEVIPKGEDLAYFPGGPPATISMSIVRNGNSFSCRDCAPHCNPIASKDQSVESSREP